MNHFFLDLPYGLSLELFFDERGGVLVAGWPWCDLLVGPVVGLA
jgi:hypothetical protein